jgi:hypothetical protein
MRIASQPEHERDASFVLIFDEDIEGNVDLSLEAGALLPIALHES